MKITSTAQLSDVAVSHNPKIKKKVMIAPGDIPHITNFSRAVFPPGEIAYAHSHDNMTEVFFVESGDGEMVVDGEVFALSRGTSITVVPKEEHELRNTGSVDLVVLYFGVV